MAENFKRLKTNPIVLSDNSENDDISLIPKPAIAKNGIIDIDSIQSRDNYDESCLKHQCESGNIEKVKTLIDQGAKPDEACVFRAARAGNSAIVDYLLSTHKTNFNVNIFSFVKDPKTLQILVFNKDLLIPPKDAIEEKMFKGVESFNKFVEMAKKEEDKNEEFLQLCKEGDEAKVAAFLQKDGNTVSHEGLKEVVESGQRKIFSVFLKTESFYLPHPISNAEDSSKELKTVLNSSWLNKLSKLGWHDEIRFVLSNGMKFNHSEIDESDEELTAILSQFPRNLNFPFNAISIWMDKKTTHSGLLSIMENAIATKQKIARLFQKDNLKSICRDDHIYIEAMLRFMDDFVRLSL